MKVYGLDITKTVVDELRLAFKRIDEALVLGMAQMKEIEEAAAIAASEPRELTKKPREYSHYSEFIEYFEYTETPPERGCTPGQFGQWLLKERGTRVSNPTMILKRLYRIGLIDKHNHKYMPLCTEQSTP